MAYCDEYVELISAAIDGALSPAEESRLAAHLAQCPGCKGLYDELALLHAALGDLPPVEPPADLSGRIMSNLGAERRSSPLHWQRWLASAAVLAVVLAGAWSWRPWEKPSNDISAADGAVSPIAESVTTEAGGVADVMPESVSDDRDEPEEPDVFSDYGSALEDGVTFDPRSATYNGTSSAAKAVIGGIQKQKDAVVTTGGFGDTAPEEAAEEEAAAVSPQMMARAFAGSADNDGISPSPLPTEAPAAASFKMELSTADRDAPAEEAEVEEALALTARKALDLVVERCFGNSGYEMFREDLEGGIPSCYVSLMDNGVLVTDGTIVYTGETEDFFLFECHWGDIPEEPYHYSVHKTEGYVAWQGEVPIDGEFRP